MINNGGPGASIVFVWKKWMQLTSGMLDDVFVWHGFDAVLFFHNKINTGFCG